MNGLTAFKRFIGCEDCQQQWTPYCPLCKSKGSSLKTLDGRSKKMHHYQYVKTEGEIYYFKKIVNNPPKKQELFKADTEGERAYWMQYHPRPVVNLILLGHDPACRCCYTIENLTRDHIMPLGKGGANTWENSQILCYECNQLKGDRMISLKELRKIVEQLLNIKITDE